MPRGSRCHGSAQELIGKHVTVLPDSFLGASDDDDPLIPLRINPHMQIPLATRWLLLRVSRAVL